MASYYSYLASIQKQMYSSSIPKQANHSAGQEGSKNHSLVDNEPDTPRNSANKLLDYKESICKSLNPSQLFRLVCKFNLDDSFLSNCMSKDQQVEKLYTAVLKRQACSSFLKTLEEDTEHMGHRYIVSLLREEEFASEEKIQKSKELRTQILKNLHIFMRRMNFSAILPFLSLEELMTDNEIEDLHVVSPHETAQERAVKLLTILDSKGPTAHYIFVYKCLARHHCHRELTLKIIQGTLTCETEELNTYQSTRLLKRCPYF